MKCHCCLSLVTIAQLYSNVHSCDLAHFSLRKIKKTFASRTFATISSRKVSPPSISVHIQVEMPCLWKRKKDHNQEMKNTPGFKPSIFFFLFTIRSQRCPQQLNSIVLRQNAKQGFEFISPRPCSDNETTRELLGLRTHFVFDCWVSVCRAQ